MQGLRQDLELNLQDFGWCHVFITAFGMCLCNMVLLLHKDPLFRAVHHCQLIPVEIWAREAKEAGHIKPIESIPLIQFFCLWYCCNLGYGCTVLCRHVLITLAMKLEVPTCFSLPTVNLKHNRNCCPSSFSTSWEWARSALSSPGWEC